MENFQKVITNTVSKTNTTPFDAFIDEIEKFHNEPVHSLSEMKDKRNTKIKGDIFEIFCKKYLLNKMKFERVWLLNEIPVHVLNQLGMIGSDFGIDILVFDGAQYSAVQCKYRHRIKNKKSQVGWADLSTFYALCARLETNGNYKFKNHIVMTTSDTCRRIGKKTKQDLSICYGTFKNLQMMDLLEMQEKKILNVNLQQPKLEQMREARLKYFG